MEGDAGSIDIWSLETPELTVRIATLGATIMSLHAPDRDGTMDDVVLGFDKVEDYFTRSPYFGCIVGRVANRVEGGRFMLDGKEYTLARNNGPNSLHGGNVGFDKRVWDAREVPGGVEMTLVSEDGDEGYPGTLTVTARYTLTGNQLSLSMRAQSTKATPVSLAQHSYFNLAGHHSGSVRTHEVTILSDTFTPVDDNLIPTGELRPVDGSVMDLRDSTVLGDRLDQHRFEARDAESITGFDHNYVLRKGTTLEPEHAATVHEPVSGRTMTVFTTAPAVQFYTANFLDGLEGKDGVSYPAQSALCLETQHAPSSIGKQGDLGDLAIRIIREGDEYSHTVVYTFTAS